MDSIGETLGLRTGDRILAVDGKESKRFNEAVLDIILGDEVTVNRDGEEITFPLTDEGKTNCFFSPREEIFMGYRSKPLIGIVADSSVAKEAGIQVGDEILGVNGVKVSYWDESG